MHKGSSVESQIIFKSSAVALPGTGAEGLLTAEKLVNRGRPRDIPNTANSPPLHELVQNVSWLLGKWRTEDGPPLHELVQNVSWLLGKWRTEDGQGIYPTIKDFKYIEELEFTHIGQPNLQFSFYSWNAATKKPLHREIGFVRVKPDGKTVALVIAANNGVTEVEEGQVDGQELKVTSHTVGRLTFGKSPETKMVERYFKRDKDTLEVVVNMETANTTMREHLRATYKKIE